MSLKLTNKANSPQNIICKSQPAGYLSMDSMIVIGDYKIETSDFCQLIEYFFKVADLRGNDERLLLLNKLCDLDIVDGFEKGNKRLG